MFRQPEDREPRGSIPRHLHDKLIAAQHDQRATHDELHDAVCAYVDELCAQGVPHEEARLTVRRLMGGREWSRWLCSP